MTLWLNDDDAGVIVTVSGFSTMNVEDETDIDDALGMTSNVTVLLVDCVPTEFVKPPDQLIVTLFVPSALCVTVADWLPMVCHPFDAVSSTYFESGLPLPLTVSVPLAVPDDIRLSLR